MKEQGLHSPKNRFVATINYAKPLSEIGSSSRAGAMTLEDAKHQAKFYTDQAVKNGTTSTVVVKENKKNYPEFEWVEIERYEA